MEPKLQELLDKIYQEGVEKGREVANALVKDAEKKAEKLLEEARREAAGITRQALEETEELKRNVISELKLSADQAIHALKQKVSTLITLKAISQPLQHLFSEEEFLKRIIESLIAKWHPDQPGQNGVKLLLPEQEEKELNRYFMAKAKELLDQSVQIQFDPNLEKGFRIGPADGSYIVSFTEKDFEAFFMAYLRPRTKELLFSNNQ